MSAIVHFLKNIFPHSCHDQVFLVGGTVRDLLLGRKSADIDLVVSISHDELTALGFRLIEPVSAAAIYFSHHDRYGTLEVTRINRRIELADDLERRDFTINAMAMGLDGAISDPLHGEADLRSGFLRACGERVFHADPLRIFRAFRFVADGWRLTPDTALLLQKMHRHDFRSIPVERFSNEMLKALVTAFPEQFFRLMIEYDAGRALLPELFRMPVIPAGPLIHHPEGDLFSHSVEVLQRVALLTGDPLSRFCAMFHDIGKLATEPALYPRHHGHDAAGFAMAVTLCDRLHLPAAYRIALAWISALHGTANKWDELRNATKLNMAERALKAGITGVLPCVAMADKPGNLPMQGWDETVRIAGMSSRDLAIDPGKLEGMAPGSRPAFIRQKKIALLKETR